MGPIKDTKAQSIARRALRAAEWIGRGESEAEACRKAGIAPFTFRNHFRQALFSEYGVKLRVRMKEMGFAPRYSPTLTL